MDELNTAAAVWKDLTPWAMGALIVWVLIFRGFPYLQERVRQRTKIIEVTAKQIEEDSHQENAWLSIYEKQTSILDRHLKLLDDIEKRTQERHTEGMNIMQEVRKSRDARIDKLDTSIAALPLAVVTEQQAQFDTMDTNIQAALKSLSANIQERLENIEKTLPLKVKSAVHEDLTAIYDQISALAVIVKEGNKQDGTNNRSMDNVGLGIGNAGNSPDDSTHLNSTGETVDLRTAGIVAGVAGVSGGSTVESGPDNRPGDSGAVADNQVTPGVLGDVA